QTPCTTDGWFGPDCQYQCHCAGSAPCDKHDGSCSSGCHQDWFGPACQYASMAFKSYDRYLNDLTWLTDRNDTTCNERKLWTVYISPVTSIPISWVRVVLQDKAKTNEIHFGYELNGSRKAMTCDTKERTAMVDKRTYDIICNIQNAVTTFYLYGEGVKSLCSLYISAGRNMALKQETMQSTTFELWNSSHAVDGKLDIKDNKSSQLAMCTQTKKNSGIGWWRLTFSKPVNVSMFRICNIRNPTHNNTGDRLSELQLKVTELQFLQNMSEYVEQIIETFKKPKIVAL
ncbi:hypothetical protein RRG08_005397, partial [Elysia crispata]